MRPFSRKSLCFFLLLALTATVFPSLPSQAASVAVGDNVLSEIDPRLFSACFDAVEDDFNLATVDWTVSGAEAEAVSSLTEAPYSPYEGSRSLLLTASSYEAGQAVTLHREPTASPSAEDYACYTVTVWVPESVGQAELTLSLRATGGRYASSATVAGGRWQTVLFDLSEASLRGALTDLTLSLTFAEDGPFFFLLDCVGGSTRADAAFTMRYLAPAYTPEGGLLSSEGMLLTLTGEAATLEATPVLTDFSGGMGIRVRLRNRSTATTLTLQYTTLGSASYDADRSLTVPIPEGEDVVSCLFALPAAYLTSFRLSFEGAQGEIEILSVTAVPCYTETAAIGELTDCSITRDKKNLQIHGSLSEEEAARYVGCPLYLYELSLWEDASSITPATPTCAETTLNGSGFSFSVPLEGDGDELFSRYAVMLYVGGSLLPVGQTRVVNNPERLASYKTALTLSSIKGCYAADGNYLFDGISETALEVRLDRLIRLSAENTLTHTVSDLSCRLDLSYVNELDALFRAYNEQGIAVRIVLCLARPDDLSLSEVLCHPSSDGGDFVAFHTESQHGIDLLRLAVDFLTRRYGTEDGLTANLSAITVGAAVNDAYQNYNLGDCSLAEWTKAYADAVRVVYNAARSVSSTVQIALPFGGQFYYGMTSGQRASFDARSAMEALSACLKVGGDIDWRVSYDIFPGEGNYAWKESSPDLSTEANRITAANLEALLSFLNEEALLYDGTARTVTLLETEEKDVSDENDRICRSADYVYTWLRLSSRAMKQITSYLPAHPVDYADTFTYIDTNRFAEVTAYAAELIGAERFAALTAEAVLNGRYVSENSAVTTIPSAVKGESTLFDFSEGAVGWTEDLYCAAAPSAVLLDSGACLRIQFTKADADLWRGVSVALDTPFDLSVAPYLSFSVRAAVLPAGVDTVELAVVVRSGNSYHRSLLLLPADTDTTVVADLSAFPALSSCDEIGIYLRGVNGEEIGEPTLLVGSVKAMSEEHSGKEIEENIYQADPSASGEKTVALSTVILLAVIGLAALLTEAVRLVFADRRRRSSSDDSVG